MAMKKEDYKPFIGDGCSVPSALRIIIPQETALQTSACNMHDRAYHLGGTRADRAIADASLLIGLLTTGMDVDLAERYHVAVRIFGKEFWGNGEYDGEPPVPQVDQSS